jgi:acid phosphatase
MTASFRRTALATLAMLLAVGNAVAGVEQIDTVVILYGENRSFDNLYGLYPGANGIARAKAELNGAQRDRDGRLLTKLPPVWREDKHAGPQVDPRYPRDLPNGPFRLDAAPVNQPLEAVTRDLAHRYYLQKMQVNGGKNDMYVAYGDAGALTMGYYDGSRLPLWQLARQYTLADNFFMAAYGGSYLNHMWLVCACTPRMPDAPASKRVTLNEQGQLRATPKSPASAMDGPFEFFDAPLTPDGYTVNTMQPPYQPSSVAPAIDPAYADPAGFSLPPQTMTTIGDTLSARKVDWAWYAGGFNAAQRDRSQISGGATHFQTHHQPFNYFQRFAPGSAARAHHLRDGADLLRDIEKGSLPAVTFYKPQGTLNSHAGYANVLDGDRHLADIVARLQASPQWKHMAIIITYDENGGFWDHVAPPKGDRWGPGARIPAIIISPFAKRGFVDHTTYDTTSILQFLTRRFDLAPLPGVRTQFGDLSNAFAFPDTIKETK